MTNMKKALLTVNEVKWFITEALTVIEDSKQTISKKELVQILGLTERCYRTYLKAGMPYTGKRSKKQFNITMVKAWIKAHQ